MGKFFTQVYDTFYSLEISVMLRNAADRKNNRRVRPLFSLNGPEQLHNKWIKNTASAILQRKNRLLFSIGSKDLP